MKVGRRENIWAQGTWSRKIEILPFKFNTLSVYFCSVQWPPIVSNLEGRSLDPPPNPTSPHPPPLFRFPSLPLPKIRRLRVPGVGGQGPGNPGGVGRAGGQGQTSLPSHGRHGGPVRRRPLPRTTWPKKQEPPTLQCQRSGYRG